MKSLEKTTKKVIIDNKSLRENKVYRLIFNAAHVHNNKNVLFIFIEHPYKKDVFGWNYEWMGRRIDE